MNNKIAILLATTVFFCGCAMGPMNPTPGPAECKNDPGNAMVHINKNGGASKKPKVGDDEELICANVDTDITFIVTPANDEKVFVVSLDADGGWLRGERTNENPAQFTVHVPEDAVMKTYKYWVVWDGKPPLDPRVAIRGGSSAMGRQN